MKIIDWNKLTIEQYINHLEDKFKFDSSGTAKSVFELIAAYKELTVSKCSCCDEIKKLTHCEDCGNDIEEYGFGI